MYFTKKGGALTLVIMVVLAVLALFSLAGYYWVSSNLKNDSGAKILSSNFLMNIAQKSVEQKFGNLAGEIVPVMPRLMGLEKPMIYLVLFLNNTEMRPGGGFIGSYAVIKVEKGKMNILKIQLILKTERIGISLL